MKKKKGQAIMETALMLPLVLFMLCAIVDLGRILYTSAQLNLVNQEAVRMAGLGKTDSEISSYVKEKVLVSDKDLIGTSITPNQLNRTSGDYVTVNVTCEVKYITPFMNKILPSPLIIRTESTIRVE